ncbi:GNAT family protein [Actinokineospora sp. NBRC 105648]|uniref:GNAT family N-acetyltransferase n=1 Tax=Actinokineospora sp. NBRC 105648 TaxID=3032206 RepID=UPI002556AEF6|nr:GNAT family protein [Actinokineospora sp. NBRC 105648]
MESDDRGPATSFRLFAHPLPAGELRLLAPYDAPAFLALIDGEREHFEPWLPWARELRTVADAAGFIARGTQRYADCGAPWVGVWSGGALVGGVLFWPLDEMGNHIELGYWLARAAGGRGLMTDAVATLVDYCFAELRLNKVVIRCAATNLPSRGVPERLGFTTEGVLREHFILDGTPLDLVFYGMLRSEWKNPR